MAPSLSRGGHKEFGKGGRASRFGLARLSLSQCGILTGREMTLWVDTVEKGLALIGEQ